MYIFNITFSVDRSIFPDWEKWLKEEFILDVLSTNNVKVVRHMRLLAEQENQDPTYCLHLEFLNSAILHQFYNTTYIEMMDVTQSKFGDKCLYFGTVLELLSETLPKG